MPTYTVADPRTGRIIKLTGDSPPTEAELQKIFADVELNDPNRKPASAEQFQEKPESGGLLASFARNILPSTTLSDYIEGPARMVQHPIDSIGLLLSALKDAHTEQFRKAGSDARGIIDEPTLGGKAAAASRTLGHTAAGLIPIVGPAAANVGEQGAAGDVRGMVGGTAGLLGGVLGPKAVAKVAPRIPGIGRTPNPRMAEAVALGEREGIPIDAATASGRPIVRRIQKRVGDTLGGSGDTERFQRRQTEALTATGRRFAEKADPTGSSSPETAGAALREGVAGKVSEYQGEANRAYSELRDIEADPANETTIQPPKDEPNPNAPHRFADAAGAKERDIFLGALKDARENGYTGTAAELKGIFDERVKSAKRLKDATAEGDEYGHRELLKSIRELGGLRMYDKDFIAGSPTKRMTTEFDNVKGFFKGQRIYTEKGLANDDLVMQLRQDPRWEAIIDENADMNDVLRDIAASRSKDVSGSDLQHFLRGEGVMPGVKWWEPTKPPVTVQAPVDLVSVKEALRPVYDRMTRQLPITQQRSSPGLKAIENIINGPDYAPLTQVDTDLSAIKGISRGADLPELRNLSEGLAARAVSVLEQAVNEAAERAGPRAVEVRNTGRQATTAKYDAAAVLQKIREEPVQAFQQATFARDAGLKHLQRVSELAPDALPKVGRAYLDDLIDKATVDGKFDRTQTLASKWENLGPETKKLLFRDPAYIKDLDNFFRLAKAISENPNPSGTAGQFTATNISTAPVMKLVSKLLYTRKGIQTLINGIRMPSGRIAAPTAALTPRAPGQLPASTFARDRRSDQQEARR